jgi:hypothetical protein
LLVIGVIVTAVIVARPWERIGAEQKNQARNNEPQQPGKLGGEVVKNPQTVFGKPRRRADEVERDSIMRGLVTLHRAYCEDNRNPNARTLDSFLQSIRTESSKLVNAVKDKEYTMNLKARVGSEDVVAYETEAYDDKTYYCVRANGQMEYLAPDALRAALGQ